MLIRESTLRKIIRDEARRIVLEQTESVFNTAAGVPGAVEEARRVASLLRGAVENAFGPTANVRKIQAAIDDLMSKGRASKYARAVTSAETVALNNDSAPSKGSRVGGKDPYKIAAMLGTLATGAVPGNYTAAAVSLLAPNISPNDNLNDPNVLDRVFTPKLVQIIDGLKMGGQNLSSKLAILAGYGVEQAPVSPAQAKHTVVRGDTISDIAATYYDIPRSMKNMQLYKDLASGSGISDPNVIKVGQVINLPATLGQYTRKKA